MLKVKEANIHFNRSGQFRDNHNCHFAILYFLAYILAKEVERGVWRKRY